MPEIVIIGCANGAGKSTFSRVVLPEGMVFVNADEIAKGLPETDSGNRDFHAGRLLIQQMDTLAHERKDFAVETTLSSRSLAPRLTRLRESGYRIQLIYVWLPSANLSIGRVAARVRRGGHDIPADTIRRRYKGGLQNLFNLYIPLADHWQVYSNVAEGVPLLVAQGEQGRRNRVEETNLWRKIRRQARWHRSLS